LEEVLNQQVGFLPLAFVLQQPQDEPEEVQVEVVEQHHPLVWLPPLALDFLTHQ
jgi:hypothetical protein